MDPITDSEALAIVDARLRPLCIAVRGMLALSAELSSPSMLEAIATHFGTDPTAATGVVDNRPAAPAITNGEIVRLAAKFQERIGEIANDADLVALVYKLSAVKPVRVSQDVEA